MNRKRAYCCGRESDSVSSNLNSSSISSRSTLTKLIKFSTLYVSVGSMKALLTISTCRPFLDLWIYIFFCTNYAQSIRIMINGLFPTIFDVLIFQVKIDVMTINQFPITLSAFLKVVVLFNLHSLKHLWGTIGHLHHQILCNLPSSGQPK